MFFFPQQKNKQNLLNDNEIIKSLSAMPANVIDIIELYDIDVRKYVSYNSGLIQTEPILKSYDLTNSDRKILIDYAIVRTKALAKKEREYLTMFEKDIRNGDYTFVSMYQELQMRCDMRDENLLESETI